jgi:hypothetical protein
MTQRNRTLTDDIHADTWHCGACCSEDGAALSMREPGCVHAALCLVEPADPDEVGLGDEADIQAGRPDASQRHAGFYCAKYSCILEVDKSGGDHAVRPFRSETCLRAEYPRRFDVHTGKPLARVAWKDIERPSWEKTR